MRITVISPVGNWGDRDTATNSCVILVAENVGHYKATVRLKRTKTSIIHGEVVVLIMGTMISLMLSSTTATCDCDQISDLFTSI